MKKFQEYLEERYINLLPQHEAEKHQVKQQVWDMLQNAYRPIGGIHGSGFSSPEEMVAKIPFWKMHRNRQGKITSVSMYKDSQGRKRVAMASDGSDEGKQSLGYAVRDDLRLRRSHGEVSGKALSFLKKNVNVTDHAHTFDQARKYFASRGETIERPEANDPELLRHPELRDHFYVRDVNGIRHTKILVGTPGKAIK